MRWISIVDEMEEPKIWNRCYALSPDGVTLRNVLTRIVLFVGANHDLIVSEVSTLLGFSAYEKMSKTVNPYGDGKACNWIVRALKGEDV